MDSDRERSALVEALESLLDSPGWSLYEGRLRHAMDKARADLETVSSWEEYLERRGKLDMLKVILGLPRRMLKEARTS